MSKRTLRRATERAARKASRVIPTPQVLTAAAAQDSRYTYDPNRPFNDDPDPRDNPPPPPETHFTDRASANRANAQKSTGPTTAAGKHTSALNSLKHGLTGNTVLLDSDDAEAYQRRLDEYVAQYKPVTLEERRLVQSIHDAAWRLDRILTLESTIYAKGRIELHMCFYELPEDQRKAFLELEIAERNAKQLRNYHLHEARLQRQRAKDITALKYLIAERQAEEKAVAAKESNGFVFANTKSPATEPAPDNLTDPQPLHPQPSNPPPPYPQPSSNPPPTEPRL